MREKNELLKSKNQKIQAIFSPFSKDLLSVMGFGSPDKLPIYPAFQEELYEVLTVQIANLLHENSYDLMLAVAQKNVEEQKILTLVGGDSFVALVKKLAKGAQETLRKTLQQPEKLLDFATKTLDSNGVPVKKETTKWLLNGLSTFSATAEGTWSDVQEIVESLLMKVMATATAGEPGSSAMQNLVNHLSASGIETLTKLTLEQIKGIQTAETAEKQQKLIHEAYGSVTKGLLKSIGFETAASLPVPELFKESIWSTLNEQIDAVLYDMTVDSIKQHYLREENIAAIQKHPESQDILALIKSLSITISEKTQEMVSKDEMQKEIVHSAASLGKIQLDASLVTFFQGELQKGISSPTTVALLPQAQNLIEDLLLSVFSRNIAKSPNNKSYLEWLLPQLTGTFISAVSRIPKNELDQIQQMMLENPRNEELIAKKINQHFGPVTQALLLQLGYDNINDLPIPEMLQEAALTQINAFVFDYYSQYFGMYDRSSKILSEKVKQPAPLQPEVDSAKRNALVQGVVGLTRGYYVEDKGKEFLMKKLQKAIPDPKVVAWMVPTIQKISISNQTLPLFEEVWKTATTQIDQLLQVVFNQISEKSPHLTSKDPKFLFKMSKFAMDTINTHLSHVKDGKPLAEQPMELKAFTKKFATELLNFVLPNGVQGLPIDEEVKKMLLDKSGDPSASLMDIITVSLADTLEVYFDQAFDPKKREQFVIKGIEKLYASLLPEGDKTEVPKDPKVLMSKTLDLAAKFAFTEAWKSVQELPNHLIGKIFGKMALHGKEKLDQLTNIILGAIFGTLLYTLFYPLVALVQYIWHKHTAKIGAEFLEMVKMPQHAKLFQDLALVMLGEAVKANYPNKESAHIEEEFRASCEGLSKELGGFKLGVVSTILNRFSGTVAANIVSNVAPHLGEHTLETIVEKSSKLLA